jgi:DNA-binding HxlR family transcriptional regulator
MSLKFVDFLPKVIRIGAYEIMKELKKSPKSWSELESIENMNPAKLKRRIKDLREAGLIQITIIFDKPTGKKVYELSPFGLKILEKLEEIEQIYEEEMKKAPPKGKEFLGKEEE